MVEAKVFFEGWTVKRVNFSIWIITEKFDDFKKFPVYKGPFINYVTLDEGFFIPSTFLQNIVQFL